MSHQVSVCVPFLVSAVPFALARSRRCDLPGRAGGHAQPPHRTQARLSFHLTVSRTGRPVGVPRRYPYQVRLGVRASLEPNSRRRRRRSERSNAS
uniref:Putative secreted protein n=1 Tax=Anopheles triannulatus TaxID=58253 RepID=A0A2M4B789_9DIPT